MIYIDELDAFTRGFADCPREPLRVVFHLRPGSRLVNYDPIQLDGLLARAVVARATRGRLLADAEDGYWIPLPLKMLWKSQAGLPLWAATVLRPVGPNVEDVYVRHKRNSEGWLHDNRKLVMRNGPWMERRIPTPVQVCDTYEALCIGNADAVRNLLRGFTHIGKLRLARVDRIEVQAADFTDLDVLVDVAGTTATFVRAVPARTEMFSVLVGELSWVGWTPPYWKPSLFQLGWRVGTRVQVDRLFKEEVPVIADEMDFFAAMTAS